MITKNWFPTVLFTVEINCEVINGAFDVSAIAGNGYKAQDGGPGDDGLNNTPPVSNSNSNNNNNNNYYYYYYYYFYYKFITYIAPITCAYDQMHMTYKSILTNKKLYD